ncbi:MAG: hypothetical protein KC486_32310 [Myxococcales bacterium]|nr:hypothetical protein [Myxococcales bacterium]
MRDRLKGKAEAAQAKVSEVIGALQTKGGEELARLSASIEEIAPAVESLGYRVLGARITVGVPPSAAIGLGGLSQRVEPERFDAVIAENAGKSTVVAVLKALKHVAGVHSKVTIKGLQADMAEITLGLPPSVSLMFERRPGDAHARRVGDEP